MPERKEVGLISGGLNWKCILHSRLPNKIGRDPARPSTTEVPAVEFHPQLAPTTGIPTELSAETTEKETADNHPNFQKY